MPPISAPLEALSLFHREAQLDLYHLHGDLVWPRAIFDYAQPEAPASDDPRRRLTQFTPTEVKDVLTRLYDGKKTGHVEIVERPVGGDKVDGEVISSGIHNNRVHLGKLHNRVQFNFSPQADIMVLSAVTMFTMADELCHLFNIPRSDNELEDLREASRRLLEDTVDLKRPFETDIVEKGNIIISPHDRTSAWSLCVAAGQQDPRLGLAVLLEKITGLRLGRVMQLLPKLQYRYLDNKKK